jgi:hypothetical protein
MTSLTHKIEIEWVHRDKDGNIKDRGTETDEITEEQWQHLRTLGLLK